jgi:hypothetical protein
MDRNAAGESISDVGMATAPLDTYQTYGDEDSSDHTRWKAILRINHSMLSAEQWLKYRFGVYSEEEISYDGANLMKKTKGAKHLLIVKRILSTIHEYTHECKAKLTRIKPMNVNKDEWEY